MDLVGYEDKKKRGDFRYAGFWVLGSGVLGLKERDRSIGDCSIRDSSGIVQLSVPPLL
jgi:hypothetical protein